MRDTVFYHEPVMAEECINALGVKYDGVYVDGTLGGGGHSQKIADIVKKGRLICIDRDSDAVSYGKERLFGFTNITFVNDNYLNLSKILASENIEKIDGLLLDLGVSSRQLDNALRGFSYMKDAPLDMRMDTGATLDAYTVVNKYEEDRLSKIMFDYGEERYSKRIAGLICEKRKNKPIETTLELVGIIDRAIPKPGRVKGSHPAKKVFQAIRIEVNGELERLSEFIKSLPDVINDGGRIAVITFHSLEDRIIKRAFGDMENPCKCPPDFPVCVCKRKGAGRNLYRKPLFPSEKETERNPRAKSAKLRAFEVNR